MQQTFDSSHVTTDGLPAGGHSLATGIEIAWQNGPLGRGDDRVEPNGAFVETVIAIAQDRLEYYQGSGFACDENEEAIGYLQQAIAVLNARTARREAAGVEGTHEGN